MLDDMPMSASVEEARRNSVAGRSYASPVLRELVDMVDPSCLRLLDIGTGTGSNLEALKSKGHEVFGLTLSRDEALKCRARGFEVVMADADRPPLPFVLGAFDGIFMCHVLEHLRDPAGLLRSLPPLLAEAGTIYVALPNAVYYKQRWEFMRGRFRYSDTGIMDRTHLRFFDRESARNLIESAGFRVDCEKVSGAIPAMGLRSRAHSVWARLNEVGLARFPGLFGFHLMFKASPIAYR